MVRTLEYRVIAAVVGINIVVAGIVGFTLMRSKAQKEQEVRSSVENVVQLLDQGLTASTEKIDLCLRDAVSELERKLHAGPRLDEAEVRSILDEHKTWVSGIADFRVTDDSGFVRYITGAQSKERVSFGDRDYFIRLRDHPDDGLIVNNPLFGKLSKTWLISFTRRYNRPDGSFAGVVLAVVPVDYFSNLLSRLNLGAHGVVLLRDSETGLIARNPPSTVPGQEVGGKVYSKELAEIIASGVDARTFHTERAGDGVERINSYRRLKALPFHAVAGMGADDYLAPWKDEVRKGVATALVFMSITSLLTWLLVRSLRQAEAARVRSDTLLKNASDGVHILDGSGNLVTASKSFYQMLGYDEAVPPPLHVSDWEAQWQRDELERKLGDLIATPQSFATRHRRRDGTVFDVEINSQGIDFDGRKLLYASSRDITERRSTEEKLKANEERLRLAMAAANQGWFDVDLRNGKVTVSDEYIRIVGYDPDEFETDLNTWLANVHSADQGALSAAFQTCVQDGGPRVMAYRRRSKSGTWKWIQSVGKIVEWGADRRAARMIGIHTDITERKRVEDALRESEEKFRRVVEQSPLAIGIVEIDGRIGYLNKKFVQTFGYLPADLPTVDCWFDLVYPDEGYRAEVFEKWQNLVESARIQQVEIVPGEYRVTCKNGDAKTISIFGVWVGDQLLAMFEDVTERRQLEDGLRSANAELEQFAYVASHDLRQPLRMVTNYLAVIEKRLGPLLEDDLKAYFGFATGGAKKMDRLITDLLEYSRTGRLGEIERVPLGKAVADALLILTEALQEAKAKVSVEDLMPTVTANRTDVVRLFQNLVSNSIKYRLPDSPPEIEIGSCRQGNEYLVWVKDNGMGIAPEQNEKAFQVFQRLVPKDSYEGTGIGLAICKKIVERIGGKIWIESEVGKGSTFFMTFPMASTAN